MRFDEPSEQFLAMQERYEALLQVWLPRAGRNLSDLGYANAFDGPDPQVLAALRHAAERQTGTSLQYTPYGGSTISRRLVAERLTEQVGAPFEWRDIVLTPGAMAALNIVFRACRRDPGADEVILLTPCWIDYPLYLVQQGIRPVFVPLPEPAFRLDLEKIAAAIGPRTRALVLTNPANPTGVLYSEQELRALAEVLKAARPGGSSITLIADECHRDVRFDGRRYESAVRYYDQTCVVYSFGKSLLMQGQRIGYAAVSPSFGARRELARGLERLCRMMGYSQPTSLMQGAIQDLVSYVPDLTRIAARRAKVAAALGEMGYAVVPSPATFFLYVRSPIADELAFVEKLAQRGVFVLPSSLFHHRGYVRLSMTATDAMIERALGVFRELAPPGEGAAA
jgi:aspartate aminotransferase